MKNLLDRARFALRTTSTFFKVSDALIALLAGGFVGAAIQEQAFSWAALIFSGLFVVIQFIKISLDRTVGESILNELWATHELNQQRTISQRDLSNFHRITKSVRRLNEITCSIDHVCDHSFEAFITPLLDAFFEHSSDLLCTRDGKLHIALYSDFIQQIHEGKIRTITQTISYRDDFNISHDEEDFFRELQSIQERAMSRNRFTIYQAQFNDKVSTMIACPIPTICEDGGTLGCVLIAANTKSEDCCNLEEVMSIYSRVISNGLAKYNACVFDRFERNASQKE